MTQMYEAETEGVLVRAAPQFLPQESDPDAGRWFWAYTIEIENHSDRPVKLLTRHWRITDALGVRHDVDGDGVVGKQPLLQPGEAFRYTSGCPLGASSGLMAGQYRMVETETGRIFAVTIPTFALDSPMSTERAN